MTQIFIENNPVDLSKDISAMLTYSIDDVAQFASRNTTFSKTIVLPGTARNNKTFGHIFDVRNSNVFNTAVANVNYNFNAAKRARCIILQDAIQTFKGWIRLIEIVIDNGTIEYEVAVFGELYGFIASVGDGKLEDLDFSSYDVAFTDTNITATWATPVGSGVVFPLIDYGGYSTAKRHWDIGTFRPALFVKDYIDKIFAAAGYTYDCALFNTARFKSLIIPHSQKDLQTLSSQVLGASRASTYNAIDSGTSTTVRLQYSTVVNTTFTASISNSKFTYTPATPATLEVAFNITGSYISNGIGYTIAAYVNGVLVPSQFYSISPVAGTASFFYGAALAFTQTFNQNDFIEIVLTATATAFSTERLRVTASNLVITSETPISVPVDYGDVITVNDTIPKNILQKDFFASIIKLFNLYVVEDLQEANKLMIAPFVDFFDGTSLDWTAKIDRSKPLRLTPMSNLNARFYDYKFKEDSDYYNETYKKKWGKMYGDYTLDSQFDFQDGRDSCDVIFSPTPLVGYSGEDKVFSTILKIEANIETRTNSNIRILQAANVTGVTAWNINGYASGNTNYLYAGHYDNPDAPNSDIHFGVPNELLFTLTAGNLSNTQFNLYWSIYMAEITDKDSKLMTATIKLDVLDIINLNFGKFIYIDGALWRINKIEDYNVSEPNTCKISLLKVIEKIY